MEAQSIEQRLAIMEEEARRRSALEDERYERMMNLFERAFPQAPAATQNPEVAATANLGQPSGLDPRSTTSEHSSGVKASLPADYDGQRKGGQAFLNNCELYIHLASSRFTDDQQKIHWALTFCKTGRAARFADRVLRHERTTGLVKYANWAAFIADFKVRFCENNEQVLALTRLEGDAWHQRTSSVDDYIDGFEELVDLAGLKTDAGLVMKFRRGLNKDIQDKVAEMESPPSLEDLEAWKQAARRFYQNVEANKAFVRQARLPASSHPPRGVLPVRPNLGPRPLPTLPPRPNLFTSFKAPPGPAPTRTELTKPKTEGPVPMEVDSSRARSLPDACYRCHQPGHIARDCPLRFDVRAMSAEEKRDLLDHLLAEADMAQVNAAEVRAESAPEPGTGEDFQYSDE